MDYLKCFFIGLLDGDGSIQVNHWRSKSLQFRIIIKLKNTQDNFDMLTLLRSNLQIGYVIISKKDDFVLFIINNQTQIKVCLDLFKIYTPLTKRLRCQIIFMQSCFQNRDITWYMQNRNLKYFVTLDMINYEVFYFEGWLSGFIEAEGCFTLRQNSSNNLSFSIAQKDEKYLMEFIAKKFDINLKVRQNKLNMFSIEIYKKSILNLLFLHLSFNPLLGETNVSFNKFKSCLN